MTRIIKKASAADHARINRREFLKLGSAASFMGLFTNPFAMLVGSLTEGFIRSAQAQVTGGSDYSRKNYAFLGLLGGPPRWTFDLPVKLKSTDAYIENPMIKTAKRNGTLVYETHAYKGLYLPSLWKGSVKTSAGDIPMTKLADNMFTLRGINTIDAHETSHVQQVRPDPGRPSMTGLVADHSHASIPAMGVGGLHSSVFKSFSGSGQVRQNLGSANPIAEIMSPFSENRSSSFFTRRQVLDAAIQSTLASLKDYSATQLPGTDVLYRNVNQAEAQLRTSLGDLGSEWSSRVGRYRNIISQVANDAAWSTLIGIAPPTTINIGQLAEGFAVIEYLFEKDLSSSVHFGLDGTNFQPNDAHEVPAENTLTNFSFYFRAIASCITELAMRLGDKWNDTYIHVGSEFTRASRMDGSGSDHGSQGNLATLFGGSINGPLVVGDITPMPLGGGYAGSWGHGARVYLDGGWNQLNNGNMTSSLTQIMGLEPIMPNFSSAVRLSSAGKIVSNIGDSKSISWEDNLGRK